MATRRPLHKQVVRGILRGLLLAFLIAASLALFAYVSVKMVFTPENVRFLLMDQLKSALGDRPVLMDSVSINPFRGIRVEGFRVLHRGETWAEPLVSSDKLEASFQVLPLLRENRLVLDDIWLENPKIRLTRYPDGSFDFEDLLAKPAGRGVGLGPVALLVAQARVINGTLVLQDRLLGRTYSADQIQLSVKRFRPSGEFPFTLSFVNESPLAGFDMLGTLGTVEASGTMDLAGLDWNRSQADIAQLHLRMADWRLSARGYIADFQHPRGALDATLSPSTAGVELRLKSLRNLLLPHLSAQVSFDVPEPGSLDLSAFQLSSRDSSVSGDAAFRVYPASSTWSVHVKSDGVQLAELSDYWRDLSPYGLGGMLRFETTVSSGPAGLRIGRSSVVLQSGSGQLGEHRIHRADVVFSAPPGLKTARLQANNVDALYFGQNLSGLSFDAAINGPDWTFRRVQGVWNGMRWDLTGKVVNFFSPKRLEIHGGVDVLRIQEIVNLAKRIIDYNEKRSKQPPDKREKKWFENVKYGVPKTFPSVAGRLSAQSVQYDYITAKDFAIRFDVSGMAPGMKTLNGFAQYSAGPGRLLNIPGMMKNSRFLDVVFLPFRTLEKISSMGILRGWKSPHDLNYNRIFGDYKATWGNVRINEFIIDTSDILMSANGQLDLPAESIQLYALNHLQHYRGKLPETWSCDDDMPCLAVDCEGDLGLPDCHVDLDKKRTQKDADVLKKRLAQFKILKWIIPQE